MLNGKTVRDALHLYLEADEAIFDKEISKSVNCFKGNRNVSGFITHLHCEFKTASAIKGDGFFLY